MAKKLKITLTKSTITSMKKHKATVHALGLRKMHHSVVKEDCPQVRGMIHSVDYLVAVEEVDA